MKYSHSDDWTLVRAAALPLFVILACLRATSGICGDDDQVLTAADLKEQGIVNFVGKEVLLETMLTWEYASVKIPEDPRSMDEISRIAGPLKAVFAGPEFEGVRARSRHFRVTGAKLRKATNAARREVYSFGDIVFANGAQFTLKVRIRLRPSFKPEMLKNPAFVKQSNNPRYWSQTFELEILGVR